MIALWWACSVPEEDYSTRRGVAECRRIEHCLAGEFASIYGNFDQCADAVGDLVDAEIIAEFSGCSYDGREAARCISRIESSSCEEYAHGAADLACDLVYVCLDAATGT
jgi:hypothetical protein